VCGCALYPLLVDAAPRGTRARAVDSPPLGRVDDVDDTSRSASDARSRFMARARELLGGASASSSGRVGWALALALALAHVARGGFGLGTRVRERNAPGAFVLHVELEFTNERAVKELLDAWAACAEWCRKHEARSLWHYEIAQNDKNALKYSIYERYRSLEDYLGFHKSTEAYRTFRPKMQALQDAGELKVSGSSYYELGYGFVSS